MFVMLRGSGVPQVMVLWVTWDTVFGSPGFVGLQGPGGPALGVCQDHPTPVLWGSDVLSVPGCAPLLQPLLGCT